MDVDKVQGRTVGPESYQLATYSTIPEIQLFRNLTLKHPRSSSWVRSKVKVTYYTQYLTYALPFRLTSIGQSEQPLLRYGQNSVQAWKKKTFPKFAKVTVSNWTSSKSNPAITMTGAIMLQRVVVIQWVFLTLSRRQAIVLLIDATAVTLSQGHGKFIQYISPDPYILCAKYPRYSSNGFDVRGKSCCGSCDGGGGRGENELKT